MEHILSLSIFSFINPRPGLLWFSLFLNDALKRRHKKVNLAISSPGQTEPSRIHIFARMLLSSFVSACCMPPPCPMLPLSSPSRETVLGPSSSSSGKQKEMAHRERMAAEEEEEHKPTTNQASKQVNKLQQWWDCFYVYVAQLLAYGVQTGGTSAESKTMSWGTAFLNLFKRASLAWFWRSDTGFCGHCSFLFRGKASLSHDESRDILFQVNLISKSVLTRELKKL